jgi:hypothetical protein
LGPRTVAGHERVSGLDLIEGLTTRGNKEGHSQQRTQGALLERCYENTRGHRPKAQFSDRTLPCEARRERIMKWRARAVAAMPFGGPLQLLVSEALDYASLALASISHSPAHGDFVP